jgi:predicted nucleic acid-binding protein
MRTIVCDAGPIIHLYEAHCLQLLRQTGNLYLPRSVCNEVQTTLQIKEPWPEWLQVISLSPHEQKEAGMWKKAGDLHAGEAETLVLARRNKADWFLTDDSTTRLFVTPGNGGSWIAGRCPVECRPQASVAGRNGTGAKWS